MRPAASSTCLAGPILKYQDVAGELHCRAVTLDGTARGVRRFILGLTKKLLLSDTAAGMVNAVFALEAGQLDFRRGLRAADLL